MISDQPNQPRPKLSDLVTREQWDASTPATPLEPLPNGSYVCDVMGIAPDKSTRGTPRLKVTLRVNAGTYAGRRIWADFYLTPAALPYTKARLAMIGIADLDAFDGGFPPPGAVIVVYVKVRQRRRDDGRTYSDITEWALVEVIDAPSPPPWAVDTSTAPTPTTTPTPAVDAAILRARAQYAARHPAETNGEATE